MRIILILMLCTLVGCSTKNRNIISVADSGIGMAVTYNPQSQLPEGKFGLIRNFVNIIPTGLNKQDPNKEDASEAVSLVSALDVDVNWSSIKISERYMVNAPGMYSNDATAVKYLMDSPKMAQ